MEDKSLLEELKALPVSQGRNRPLENLTPEQAVEWTELKTAMRKGQLDHLSRNEIRRHIVKRFDIDRLPESTFRKILIREGVILDNEE
jgi:hypothetical protein